MSGFRGRLAAALAGVAAFGILVLALGCEPKPPPAPPPPPNRIDETMRTLGAEGLRLEDATVVVQLSPAGITRSRFYRRLTEVLAKTSGESPAVPPHEALLKSYGIDLSGIEAVVFTVDPERNTFVLAAATRAPVKKDVWLAALPKIRNGGVLKRFDTYGGVELFAPPRVYEGAIAFPGEQLIAAGSTAELMKGIDATNAGKSIPYRPAIARLLAVASPRAAIIIAAVPTRRLMAELTAVMGGPSFAAVSEKAEGILLAATAHEGLEVEFRMFMRTTADATAAREEARATLRSMEETLSRAGAPAEARPFIRLVDDVKVGGTGKEVEISVTIPPSVLAPLVRLGTSRAPKPTPDPLLKRMLQNR